MSSEELRTKIVRAIKSFKIQEYYLSADKLLACMGYTSSRRLPLQEKTPQEFLDLYNKEGKLNEQKALIEKWRGIDLLFQLTGGDLDLGGQSALPLPPQDRINQNITSYLFFALELHDASYTRTELSNITREINKCFHIPVMLVVKHGTKISIAIIHRRPNKRESDKDVLEKVTLIKDININHPHRAHVEILADLSLQEIISKPSPPKNIEKLHEVWRSLLDLKELNKNFYKELSNWYFWAIKECSFPPEAGPDETRNPTSVIRIITRLIFIWFIKEKGLVPDELFDKSGLQNILKSLNKEESTYYKAILQNLFFATLNQEDSSKRKFVEDESFQGKNRQYGVFNVFRYKEFFTEPDQALNLFKDIPFLNGGLFECLDRERETGEPIPDGLEKEICRVDGFSGRTTNPLLVPNKLFFSEDHAIDLNNDYGTSKKHYRVSGLIEILHRYKFTIEENTPLEEEIALDPELLGRVFENLLASYNPETQSTARKATGSYYTPREIVNYMVDESLIAYLDQKLLEFNPEPKTHTLISTQPPLAGDHEVSLSSESTIDSDGSPYEQRLRRLFDYAEHSNPFDINETDLLINAIDTIKVLDPACGSGAFPMGVLHRLVFLIGKLDEHNQHWKKRQLEKVNNIEDKEARERSTQAIENAFENNELDYGRKLYLIQNCIYGVDIQPIAVQIAKLRFFISLIVDQKADHHKPNCGIASLPNLESKFVAANSLLGIDNPDVVAGHQMALGDNTIEEIQKELFFVRENHFNAHTRAQKKACQIKDKNLRKKLAEELEHFGWSTSSALQLATWDPYAQNTSSDFFDPEWMFGIKGGFNIVIGNPPYIRQEEIGQLKPLLMRNKYDVYNSTSDIYTYFYEMGLEVLKETGFLCFITSNKWMRAKYGEKLRVLLKTNTKIHQFIDFSGFKVFDATVDTNIILLEKENDSQYPISYWIVPPNLEINEFKIGFDINKDNILSSDLNDIGWVLISGPNLSLKKKIDSTGKTIKQRGLVVNLGIKTGLNSAFIIDGKKREMLISKDPNSNKIIKPLLRGRDIEKYHYEFADQWLINTHNGVKSEGVLRINPKKDFPAIFDYLSQFGSRIRERGDQGDHWSNLRNCAYLSDFSKNKIVWSDIATEPSFVWIEDEIYFNNTCYMIANSEKYLVSILNSNLIKWYFPKISSNLSAKGSRYFKQFVETIPIPDITDSIKNNLCNKVDEYINNKNEKILIDIDKIVYELYGLTEEEIAIVEYEV